MTRESLFLLTFIVLVAFTLISALNYINRRAKRKRFAVKPRALINEPRIKIMHNPFKNTYMWVRLNPRTHTWEWEIDASPAEVESWMRQPESVRATGVLIERRDVDYVEKTSTQESSSVGYQGGRVEHHSGRDNNDGATQAPETSNRGDAEGNQKHESRS